MLDLPIAEPSPPPPHRRLVVAVDELYGGRVLSDEAAAALNKALEVEE